MSQQVASMGEGRRLAAHIVALMDRLPLSQRVSVLVKYCNMCGDKTTPGEVCGCTKDE